MAMKKVYQVIIYALLASAAFIFLMMLLSGCKTPNLFINGKFEIAKTKEPFINKEGLWHETGGRYVPGKATGDMLKDSTYRMETKEGWNMHVRYDRIYWMDQLATGEIIVPAATPPKTKNITSVDYGF
jgi:hypothetical protein